MPQITLEFTANVNIGSDWGELAGNIHQVISRTLELPVENCKTRIVEHSGFSIGDGGENKAFVHLEVRLLEGRPGDLKQAVGSRLLTLLQTSLLPENNRNQLQLTVEIADIPRKNYFKYPKESITFK